LAMCLDWFASSGNVLARIIHHCVRLANDDAIRNGLGPVFGVLVRCKENGPLTPNEGGRYFELSAG
jgi:hypothetical protein